MGGPRVPVLLLLLSGCGGEARVAGLEIPENFGDFGSFGSMDEAGGALSDKQKLINDSVFYWDASFATGSTGDFVSALTNQASSGLTLDQATQANQPNIIADVFDNGTRVVSFDGITDKMSAAATSDFQFLWGTKTHFVAAYVRMDEAGGSGGNRPILCNTFTGANRGYCMQAHGSTRDMRVFTTDGTTTVVSATHTSNFPLNTWTWAASRGDGANLELSYDLSTWVATTAYGTPTDDVAASVLNVGTESAAGGGPTDFAVILLIVMDHVPTAAQITTLGEIVDDLDGGTAPTPQLLAAFGDSNTALAASRGDIPWPHRVEIDSGGAYVTANYAVGGDRCTHQDADYGARVQNNTRADLVAIACGVNNINNGDTGAATWTEFQLFIDEVRADSLHAYAYEIPPYKNFSGWSAGEQAELDVANNSIRTYAPGTLYTPLPVFGDLEGDPDELSDTDPDLDADDGLHWNQAGSDVVAARIKSALGGFYAGFSDGFSNGFEQ